METDLFPQGGSHPRCATCDNWDEPKAWCSLDAGYFGGRLTDASFYCACHSDYDEGDG